MVNNDYVNWLRLWAMMKKEFRQMKRHFNTFLMLLIVPTIQMILFGLIINTDPKHLPTAVLNADTGVFSQRFIEGLKNTEYFWITHHPATEQQAEELLEHGQVNFIINIPLDFTEKLLKEDQPHILLEADGTQPMAITNAIQIADNLSTRIFEPYWQGSLSYLASKKPNYILDVHYNYNPEMIAHYSILPGLFGIILCTTMVMLTAISITAEYELGTMETLLSTPVKPLEVILGKMIPGLFLSYVLLLLMMFFCHWGFQVPFVGHVFLLLAVAMPYFAANLGTGLLVSTFTKTQLEAMTVGNFYLLPTVLLSGFLFPLQGMPIWAQHISELLPVTHFMRIARGIMLKGLNFAAIWQDLWPILVFMLVVIVISIKRYHKTLD